jgi:hypothetical protein
MTTRPPINEDEAAPAGTARNRRALRDRVHVHVDRSPPHLTPAAARALIEIARAAGHAPLPALSVESAAAGVASRRGHFDLPAISPGSPRGWSEGLPAAAPRARFP